MSKARALSADTAVVIDSWRQRIRQKTNPQTEAGGVFETLGGKDGEDDSFSYEEALRKSLPELIGFAHGVAKGVHRFDLDDRAWISSHWESSSH